jgi:hypothetical protein
MIGQPLLNLWHAKDLNTLNCGTEFGDGSVLLHSYAVSKLYSYRAEFI